MPPGRCSPAAPLRPYEATANELRRVERTTAIGAEAHLFVERVLRLQRAGCERELFASDAIGLLHEATLCAMRDIDRLAAAALRETAKKKRKLVERDVVARVIEADNRER